MTIADASSRLHEQGRGGIPEQTFSCAVYITGQKSAKQAVIHQDLDEQIQEHNKELVSALAVIDTLIDKNR